MESIFAVGQSEATVIEDSISTSGARITTLKLRYPRIIHSELMTHRVFSRNAQSSRATPVKTMIESVRSNPYMPLQWREAQKGMVPGEELDAETSAKCSKLWRDQLESSLNAAEELAEIGAAKEQVNRLLEPFSFINVLVTATEWDNFFRLRLSENAQFEIRQLAKAMKSAMDMSIPVHRDWHLPFVTGDLRPIEPDSVPGREAFMISAARCARVSYLNFSNHVPKLEEDMALANRLYRDRHMSPFEHSAIGLPDDYDRRMNIFGWKSARYMIYMGDL